MVRLSFSFFIYDIERVIFVLFCFYERFYSEKVFSIEELYKKIVFGLIVKVFENLGGIE